MSVEGRCPFSISAKSSSVPLVLGANLITSTSEDRHRAREFIGDQGTKDDNGEMRGRGIE